MMKYVILISSILFLFQGKKIVYIQGKENSTFVFNERRGTVNLYIDPSLIKDKKINEGVKLYLASFFVSNKSALKRRFIEDQHLSFETFVKQNKKDISNVIYYLEHIDHGNLPLHLGRDAYSLLEIKELKPYIEYKKALLNKEGMLLIDVLTEESSTEIEMVTEKRFLFSGCK